jgi:hypothetical protein
MHARGNAIGLWVVVVALAAGCGGDLSRQVLANPEQQDQVMTLIASSSATAGAMMDHLLGSDTARAVVIDKALGNAEAAQSLMVAMARDPTTIEGVLNLAMQDSSMRHHVRTLFKGMQIAGMK